jgi:hypothetical protein
LFRYGGEMEKFKPARFGLALSRDEIDIRID